MFADFVEIITYSPFDAIERAELINRTQIISMHQNGTIAEFNIIIRYIGDTIDGGDWLRYYFRTLAAREVAWNTIKFGNAVQET